MFMFSVTSSWYFSIQHKYKMENILDIFLHLKKNLTYGAFPVICLHENILHTQ